MKNQYLNYLIFTVIIALLLWFGCNEREKRFEVQQSNIELNDTLVQRDNELGQQVSKIGLLTMQSEKQLEQIQQHVV